MINKNVGVSLSYRAQSKSCSFLDSRAAVESCLLESGRISENLVISFFFTLSNKYWMIVLI